MVELSGRETILVDAIAARLAEIHPAEGKQDRSMPESNGGQYRALQSDVESVRVEFHDFKTDVNLRFSEIATGIKGLEGSLAQLLLKPARRRKKEGGDSWLSGAFPAMALALSIAGAFGGVIKMNIDSNVAFAQERTTTAEKHLTDDLLTLTSVVKGLQETTIPRLELESRFNTLRDTQKTKADKDTIDQVIARLDGQVAYQRSDVERLKGDIVTRRENESHWSDLNGRVNLLSDRVNDLARSTNGATLADQIKNLQEQINGLLRPAH